MDSLRELTDLLAKREDGMSFSELKSVFNDADEIKNFLKIGLDTGVIAKEGEKRGTRYFKVSSQSSLDTANHDNDILGCYDLEQYLKSDKPIHGQAVVTKVTNFGPYKKNGSVNDFLNSGRTIESFLVAYNKSSKKNEIVYQDKVTRYNKVILRYEDKMFSFIKLNNNMKMEVENFKLYEDFREHIRSSFI